MKNFIDVQETRQLSTSSPSSSWWNVCQMTDKGAILVRSDGAWSILLGELTLLKSYFYDSQFFRGFYLRSLIESAVPFTITVVYWELENRCRMKCTLFFIKLDIVAS
ncbi:hypothetical protein SDJN03_06816, partial [Cucurbita argyrosperma subsp. sororia]